MKTMNWLLQKLKVPTQDFKKVGGFLTDKYHDTARDYDSRFRQPARKEIFRQTRKSGKPVKPSDVGRFIGGGISSILDRLKVPTDDITTIGRALPRVKTPFGAVKKTAIEVPKRTGSFILDKLKAPVETGYKKTADYFKPTEKVRVRDVAREVVPTFGKAVRFGGSMVQEAIRYSGGGIGMSLRNLFADIEDPSGKSKITEYQPDKDDPKIERALKLFIFGEKAIKPAEQLIVDAGNWIEEQGEKGVWETGKERKGAPWFEKIARKGIMGGLEKHPMLAGMIVVPALITMDFTGFGAGKQGAKTFFKYMAKADVAGIAKGMRQVGVAEDIIKVAAPKIHKLKNNPIAIEKAFKKINSLQGATKVSPIKTALPKAKPKPSAKALETMRRPQLDPLITEARKYKSAEGFVEKSKNIIHRGDTTLVPFEKLDTIKVFDPSKTETLGAFNNTPGLYFTTSLKNAKSYGKNITSVSIKNTAKILDIDDAVKTISRSDVEKIVRSNPNIKDEVSNYSENFDDGFKQIIDNIMAEKDGNEFLKAIWADGGFANKDFPVAMKNFGVDGLKIKKEDVIHYVIYNKNALKTKSQLTDIYNKAKALPQAQIKPVAKSIDEKGIKGLPVKKEVVKTLPKRITEKTVKEFVEKKPAPFIRKRETTLLKERIKKIQKSVLSDVNKKAKIQRLESEFKIRLEETIRKEQLKTLKVGITERIKGIAKGVRESRVLTKDEITKTQTEIINILDESRLDRSDKAKFIRAIKNVQTTEQLKKALPKIQTRIEVLAEKADVRTLKSKIGKELKNTTIKKQAGKPVGKFTPEVQKNLDMFRKTSKLSKSEAELKIQMNIEKYKNTVPPEDVALDNKILSMVAGMDEMTSSELKKVLDQVVTIKNTGRLTSELKKFNRQTDIDMWTTKAIDIITGGKGLPKNISTVGITEVSPKTLKESVQKFVGKLGKEFVGWDDIIDMISRKTKTKKTWLDDFADVTAQENAVKKGHRINLGGEGKVRKMAEESFDITKDRKMVKRFQDDAKEISLGNFKNAQGDISEIIYTKAEARKVWMEMQDPSLTETFEKGMYYTDEIGKAIDDFLTPQDKVFAKKQLAFYKDYYDDVNKVYRDIYGVDLPKNDFYSPIRREGIARDESVGFGEFMQEISTRKSVSSGSLKSRVSNIKPLARQSDISAIEQHITEMEHFKSWAHKIRDLNAVFGDTQVRTALTREHGKGMMAMVDNFMGDFTRGGSELASRLGWLDKLRGNFSRAILAVKPSIGIKQLTSFVAYADSIPIKNFTTGTLDFWTNPIKKIKILKQSEMMLARGKHMERDIKTALSSDAYSSFRKKPNFLNSLMLNVQMGDQGAIYAGGWSVYKYHRGLGKSHKEALRIFEKVTSTTQQSADLSKLSSWQRGGSFAKLFTMFKSAPNQYFRKEMGAIRNVLHGKGTIKQHAKTIAIYQFVLPMLFQYVSDGFKWNKEEQKRAAILGPFNGIFLVGDGLDSIIRASIGLRQFPSEIPIYSIANDLGKAMKLISDDNIDSEDVFRAIRGLAGATGAVKGLPLKQPIDIGTGVKDVLTGEYEQGLAEILGWSPYVAGKMKGKTEYEKAVSADKEKDKKERKKFEPTYKKIRELGDGGQMDKAMEIIDKLTDEEYEIYKKIKSSEETKTTNKKKEEFYPTFLKIREAGEKDEAEAMKMINSLTDEEYKIYESLRNQLD